MSDTLLEKARLEIMQAQTRRFKEFYGEYFNREDSADLVNFFMDKIYNLDSQGDIIQTAINTFGKIKNKLPAEIKQSIQDVIDLNDVTHQMDEGMAAVLVERGWTGDAIETKELTEVYKQYGHRAERIKQLEVMIDTLEFSHQLAHSALGKVMLGPARLAARLFRVMVLFEFLEEGYLATRKVSAEDFNDFLHKVEEKEWEYLYGNLGKV
ncbi:MAG: hypothetical protein M0D57_01130 [Sphingobacteriales bacterium JAD_PAG50586_3]|nr:MAG: hypothetical protein M0D57_01130 [Sphingobacteriales bacterium JAD_PAG50586_3]